MTFSLPELPYGYDALEPYIDKETMQLHHDKHHAAYINNLNNALTSYEGAFSTIDDLLQSIDQLPDNIRTAVRNNGGGHANHSFFWKIMSPNSGSQPIGELAMAIDNTFGSFADMQKEFTEAAKSRFGSGWAWLVVDADGNLQITSTANQDSPLMNGLVPVIGLDVWEHAYYLRYRNVRPDYIEAWWNVVNWQQANDNYLAALQK